MPAQIETAIPLGRRIGEIMEEKGDAFSYRAFGERIGISKDILSRCINGERYIKPSELERICNGLNIEVERLKQEDLTKELEELQRLMNAHVNHKRIVFLASKWSQLAIGMTERCQAFNLLGKAFHDSRDYEQAHKAWLEAYNYAQKINDRYGEKDLLYRVVKNLMVSFTVRKEYVKMSEILSEAENQFSYLPEFMGAICYSRANLAAHLGDIFEAKRMIYLSLEYFRASGKSYDVGRAMVNVADFEYTDKNYGKAKKYLEEALKQFGDDTHTKLFVLKEYVKVLLKIGDSVKAVEVIHQALGYNELKETAELFAKFNILLSIAEKKEDYSLKILEDEGMSEKVRRFASIQLTNHYYELGDGVSFLRYYKIAETLGRSRQDILDMEGF